MTTTFILLLGFSYLTGSIPFGKLVASRYGINIQKRGSGNIGFANVRRIVGWKAGLVTLAGDILKGFVPTILTLMVTDNQTYAYFAGLTAIAGHVFPVWLRFKGGKGIATGLGVIAAIVPYAALLGSIIYVLVGAFVRKSSTASITGVVAVTAISSIIYPSDWWQYMILLLIACYTLRDNLRGQVPNYDT